MVVHLESKFHFVTLLPNKKSQLLLVARKSFLYYFIVTILDGKAAGGMLVLD